MINRRHEKSWSKWLGDMSVVTDFLMEKSWWSPWFFVKYINTLCRAVGVVAFINNPFSGMVILLAMFIGNPIVFYATLLASIIGILGSLALHLDPRLLSDGVTTFNTILVGCVSACLYPIVFQVPITWHFWVFLTPALVGTVFIDVGMNAIMAASTLPALSIPFNVASAIMYLCISGGGGPQAFVDFPDIPETTTSVTATQTTSNTTVLPLEVHQAGSDIDWFKVWHGTLLAIGQVYGVGTSYSSLLVYLATFLFSPLLTALFYMGSCIGTLVAVAVSSPPYTLVYEGVWGFNGLLTSGACVYFMVLTPHILPTAVVGAALVTAVQAALVPIFGMTNVPVMSYPFNVVTLLLIAISTMKNSPFVRVMPPTFPELHMIQHYKPMKTSIQVDDVLADPELNGGLR